LAAAAAAVAVAAASAGDVAVLAAALALAHAGGRPRPGPASAAAVAVALAGASVVLRWGSSSLTALAGAQAVLGPAGWVGPPRAAASSWCAAAALVLATPPVADRTGGRVGVLLGAGRALASGLAAAAVVAGPGPWAFAGVRVPASAVAVLAAWLAGRALPRWAGPGAGLCAGVAAVVLAASA
jgi:hypothetical protein